jgi:beta-lactamase regulating signal transducer with metallopeptidase domain
MTHAAILQTSTTVLSQLASPAARALVLATGAALGLFAFRVKATSVRLFTWSAVLYAALAMPLLGWMLPPMWVPTPAVLQHSIAQSNEIQASRTIAAARMQSPARNAPPARIEAADMAQAPTAPPMVAPAFSLWNRIQWNAAATSIYFIVALLLLARLVVGLIFARRLTQASQTIQESRLTARLAARAYACGLRMAPKVAQSEFISVPVTMGAFRSTILLPASWREWDDAKLDAVIAHEVSHVARGDALTQRLSLLHRAIFWFSPLTWWLDRHLAELAEQVSDEAALSCGADRTDYAKTLLGFFEAVETAPGRVWWQGVSMAKAGQAEQRLERILAWRGAVTMGLKKSGLKKTVAVAIVAFAIPAVYLAASVRPANSRQSAQGQTPPAPAAAPVLAAPAEPHAPAAGADSQLDSPPAPDSAPAIPPGPAAPVSGVSNSGPAPVLPMVPGTPIAPVQPVVPTAGWAGQASSSHNHGYSYAYGYDDEQRFVIVTGKSDSLTMSGTTEDARHVEKLRKKIPGDFIWFERDEKSYIIRDQATVDRARKLWAPQQELGEKQEALGKQQEELGKQQEALGKRMEEIQVKVPDLTAELDKLRAELKQLSSGATAAQVGKIQSEIGELQSKIGEVQSHAGDQQSKLGEAMGALGEKQGHLGELQGELGRQQGELAQQASRQMKELLDEAIKNGSAKPEPETEGTASL